MALETHFARVQIFGDERAFAKYCQKKWPNGRINRAVATIIRKRGLYYAPPPPLFQQERLPSDLSTPSLLRIGSGSVFAPSGAYPYARANVSIHLVDGVEEAIEARGARIFYLPLTARTSIQSSNSLPS